MKAHEFPGLHCQPIRRSFPLLCWWVLATLVAGVTFAQEARIVDEGLYLMFSGKDKIGTEHSTLRSDNSVISEVELSIMGRQIKFDVALQYEGKRPVKYQLNQAPGITLTAQFENDKVTVTAPGRSQELTLKDGTVVLENNVFGHYCILLQRYELSKGGKQAFPILVPSVMQALEAVVEHKGATEQMVNQQLVKLHQFQVLLAGMVAINITTDENLRLVKIDIPSQNIELIREGYESFRQPPNIPDLNSDQFESIDVSLPSTGDVTVAGTLTIPKDGKRKHPAVILISGSGPQDREENTPPMLSLYIFRYIANDLASHGIAVLRCDDRGVGRSSGDFRKSTLKDFTNDARAQIKFLRSRDDIDGKRIGVIGHSEGGIIAPIVAAEDKEIAACVLLAGTSKPLDVVMIEQLEFQATSKDLPEAARDAVQKMIEPTKQVIADAKAGKDSSTALPYNLEWLRQHFAHDPIATIKKVKCPVLILQGEKDMQVLPYHAEALDRTLKEAGNRDHQLVSFSDLTHLFTEYPYVNGQFNPEAVHGLSQKLLEALTPWVEKRLVGN